MRYIDIKEVMHKIGMSRVWIYNKIAEGSFPKAVKLGKNCSRWVESEIEEWMQAQLEQRNKAA